MSVGIALDRAEALEQVGDLAVVEREPLCVSLHDPARQRPVASRVHFAHGLYGRRRVDEARVDRRAADRGSLLDEGHARALAGCVRRGTHPRHSAAKDEEVDLTA